MKRIFDSMGSMGAKGLGALALGSLVCLPGILERPATIERPQAARIVPQPAVVHDGLVEISGVVKSKTYPGVYWVHNDSGDTARTFAVRDDGTVIVPPFDASKWTLGKTPGAKPFFPGVDIRLASNVDWEDIATDGVNLYLADTGNNGNARKDLSVYVVPEPNPEATTLTTALKRIPVHYPEQTKFPPEQWHFDTEAMYWSKGKLYFLTKWRAPGKINQPESGCALYRLNSDRSDRSNPLTFVAEAKNLSGWVTGADVSPDNKKVAVLCGLPKPAVFVYPSDKVLVGTPHRIDLLPDMGITDRIEAIAWINDENLMLISESGQRWTVSIEPS